MKSKIIGILLLLFAIYTPISLFGGLSPFGSGSRELYIYKSLPLILNELPEDIEVREISNTGTRIEVFSEIRNPEYYGLELSRKIRAYDENMWYYPAVGIFIVCCTSGLILLIIGIKGFKRG